MKHLLVVCALCAASLTLTTAPPTNEARASAPASEVVVVGVLPSQSNCELDLRPPLRDMTGFRRISSQCYYKEWLLRGTAQASATGRSVANYYVDLVRTSVYKLNGDISCRRDGNVTVCTQYLQLRPFRSTCTNGTITIRLGPVRTDGRRVGSVRIVVATGC